MQCMRHGALLLFGLPLAGVLLGCSSSSAGSAGGTSHVTVSVVDHNTNQPVAGAQAAIESGGRYIPNTTCPTAGPCTKGNPSYTWGALTNSAGQFTLTLNGVSDIGVHTYFNGYFYGSQELKGFSDGATMTVPMEPLGTQAKPTLTNPTMTPTSVAAGGAVTVTVNAAAASSNDPLSEETIISEATTQWSKEFDPPGPGYPGKNYPDGTYTTTFNAPAVAGTYTYYLSTTTEGCATSDLAKLTLTVQ
jgi:hypothetical protein